MRYIDYTHSCGYRNTSWMVTIQNENLRMVYYKIKELLQKSVSSNTHSSSCKRNTLELESPILYPSLCQMLLIYSATLWWKVEQHLWQIQVDNWNFPANFVEEHSSISFFSLLWTSTEALLDAFHMIVFLYEYKGGNLLLCVMVTYPSIS